MKKTFAALLTLMLWLLCTVAFAQGQVAGHIYSTDILAFVNGRPIDGYNIGGKTVVIAEDLDHYGFHCFYNDESRTLDIEAYFYELREDIQFAPIPRGQVGEIVGDIYETDIKVSLNGIEIAGYNIGGRTAICLEEMGDLQNSPYAAYGYSKYLGQSVWNEEERTIAYDTFKQNENQIFGKLARVSYHFKDNVLYAYPDEGANRLELKPMRDMAEEKDYYYSEDFPKNLIMPLSIDVAGEKTQVGLAVTNPNNEYDTLLKFFDVEQALALTSTAKAPRLSYEEAMAYFSEKYIFINRLDNDDYTVLHINDAIEGVLFVYVNKKGGYIMDDFFKSYGDKEIKVWFSEKEPNVVCHSVYPFGGPHGVTTMNYDAELDSFDYE